MRILILTAVYPPLGYSGHDERCRQTVHALARRGHQLQVLTSDHRLPPMGVEGEKGVFRELRLHPEASENSVLGSSYAATYAHERYNAESLEYRLRRFKPDVVYVWNMRSLSKSLLFRMQERGVRFVCDLNSDWLLPENFNADPWYRWWKNNPSLRSRLYRLSNRVIGRAGRILGMLPINRARSLKIDHSYVVSDWLKERLSELGIEKADDLPVIRPSIDLNKLVRKIDYQRRNHFVWAGRLKDAKGPDIAVDAVGILKSRGIDVKLDIFGMGQPSERKAKRERIEAAGLSDRVIMQGIRPGEMTEHYANYDALLYTNRTPEAFSMAVLEAMLSGLPCLVSRVGGNQEILAHRENALLFDADSAEALADAIGEFIKIEDVGRSLANQGIEELQESHRVDNFCEQVESLLST